LSSKANKHADEKGCEMAVETGAAKGI